MVALSHDVNSEMKTFTGTSFEECLCCNLDFFFLLEEKENKTEFDILLSYNVCVAIGKCAQRSLFCSEVSVQVLLACICQVSVHFLSSTETLLSLCRQLRLFSSNAAVAFFFISQW